MRIHRRRRKKWLFVRRLFEVWIRILLPFHQTVATSASKYSPAEKSEVIYQETIGEKCKKNKKK